MEPQTARYNQYSRAESSKMASGHHQPPGGGEGNDGSISDSALSFNLTEGRRKRRSSIGTKWLLSLGSTGTKATAHLRFRPTVIIIFILFIVVVVIIVAQLIADTCDFIEMC